MRQTCRNLLLVMVVGLSGNNSGSNRASNFKPRSADLKTRARLPLNCQHEDYLTIIRIHDKFRDLKVFETSPLV